MPTGAVGWVPAATTCFLMALLLGLSGHGGPARRPTHRRHRPQRLRAPRGLPGAIVARGHEPVDPGQDERQRAFPSGPSVGPAGLSWVLLYVNVVRVAVAIAVCQGFCYTTMAAGDATLRKREAGRPPLGRPSRTSLACHEFCYTCRTQLRSPRIARTSGVEGFVYNDRFSSIESAAGVFWGVVRSQGPLAMGFVIHADARRASTQVAEVFVYTYAPSSSTLQLRAWS